MLTLPDVVAIAVGGSSGLELARIRLQRAQELVNQVNAQLRPQFRVNANDAYSSYPAFPSVIPLPTIATPALPDNGIVPTVVDQAGGIPTGFAGQAVSVGSGGSFVSPGATGGGAGGATGNAGGTNGNGGGAGAGGTGSAGATAGTPGASAGSAGPANSGVGPGSPGGAGGAGAGTGGAGTNGTGTTGTNGVSGTGTSGAGGANSGNGTGAGSGASAGTAGTGGGSGASGASPGGASGQGAGAAGTNNSGTSATPGANNTPGPTGNPGSNGGAGAGASSSAGVSQAAHVGLEQAKADTQARAHGFSNAASVPNNSANTALLAVPAIVAEYVADTRTLTQPPTGSAAVPAVRTAASEAHPDTQGDANNTESERTASAPRDATAHADTPTGSAPTASRAVGKRNTYATGASVSQFIDLFGIGGTTRGVEQDEQRFYALDITRLQNETALVAKNLFFNALYAQALVATQQEQVRFAQENVRITQSRLRNGIVSRYDVLTAQATLANAQQQLLAAQDQQQQAQANLAYLLGTDPNQPLSLQNPALPPLNQAVNLGQSTQLAQRQRPELAQARGNIGQAQRLVRLAGNGLLPTLGLVGTGEYTSNGSTVTPRSYATVSAQLAVPLDDGGLTRFRVRTARLDVRTQSILADQLSQSVSLEVRQATINIRNAQGQAGAAQTGLIQAEEARRLALERYTAGLGTFLDVLNAQATLAATRTNLANAQFFYQSSLAQLVRAMGGR